MKKLYFLIVMLIQTGLCFADNNPNNFQYRLVSPGGEPGVFRVQVRCINPANLPTTANFCHDMGFVIYWSDPMIVDIDVVQTTSIGAHLNEGPPAPGNANGSGAPYSGTIVPVGFCANTCGGFVYPTDWVLNQWVNLASINICSVANCTTPDGAPAGITAEDFQIQAFIFQYPNVGIDGIDFTPAGGQPLPLNLISFHATKSGDRDAHLTWTTANEENTSHFIVERSFDKQNWEVVGSVGAAGNSVDIRNYELTDLEVNNGRASRVRAYYRLKMVDLDGRSTTSPIESIIYDNGSVTAAVNNFEVFPNPASDGVYVTWDQQENLDQPSLMELFDITGKLVFRQVVSDKTDQEYIDLESANVKAGVYMLRILNGSTPLDHKQIVVGQN